MAEVTHPSLFDMEVVERTAAPPCRMCSRPARWNPRQSEWSSYCAGASCTNRERACQADGCGKLFIIGVDGAGTKYCSTDCKKAGYGAAWRTSPSLCAWCGKPADRSRPAMVWPYICRECVDPIKHLVDRLRRHRVPHEMARRLLDAPGCEVCGRDIVSKVRNSEGHVRALLVVDHDHECCPGSRSCGRCVRGFLCPNCNAASGMVGENPSVARRLADYIERPRL